MAAKIGETSYRMSNEHRDKIKNSNILNALIEHVEGNRDMTATQVAAGVALLRKVLPDLASMQVSGDGENGALRLEIAWANVGGSSSTTVPDDSLPPSTTDRNAGPSS